MMPLLQRSDLATGLRFIGGLPGFLRRPIVREEALATLRARLAQREADLLALARTVIFQNPASPYRPLLRHAGCELGDLERLLGQEGVEGALQALFRQGVYLTVEEFKGRRPIVRGSTSFRAQPGQFRNPRAGAQVALSSSGGRGAGTPIMVAFDSIREQAVSSSLYFAARGALGWDQALWGVPGSTSLMYLLEWPIIGARVMRWFSQIDPASPGLHPRYRWSAQALRWGGFVAGKRLPAPQYVPLENPLAIVHWMAETLRAGRTPIVNTFSSSAVRIAQTALGAGLDLRGAQMTVSGEPVTATRLAALQAAGLQAVPRFGASEVGYIGYGCLAPTAPDDLHAVSDLHVLTHPAPGSDSALPPDALLLSSLRPYARSILFNVSLGDRATIDHRVCGCPAERVGWTTHLSEVRSFEKLTVGGMALLDLDLLRVMEDVLPAHFGGDLSCYQFVEDLTSGAARLRLRVHPRLGPLDEARLADVVLSALGATSASARVLELHWREAKLLSIERRPPETTTSGKLLQVRRESGSRAEGAALSRPG